jgi:succinate dehydrogenase flavin-adding protein (antitoxin of CptAB toxin-antitoxin module)
MVKKTSAIREHENLLIDYIIKHFIKKELKYAESYNYPQYIQTLETLQADLVALKEYNSKWTHKEDYYEKLP